MFKKKVLVASVVILTLTMFIFSLNEIAGASLPKSQPIKIPDFSKSEDLREWFANNYGDRSRDDLGYPPPKEDLIKDTNLEEGVTKSESSRSNYHRWWGAGIYQVKYPPLYQPTIKGALAKHYIDESLTLGTDEARTLYAPTLMPPNPNPIEVSTVYRYHSALGQQRYLGIWDWTDPGDFSYRIYFDELEEDGWLAEDGVGVYYETAIAWNPNLSEWVVYLHNYDNSSWPIVYGQEDDDDEHSVGWDIYEVYYDSSWPETPYLRADEIMVFYEPTQTWSYNTSPSGHTKTYWPGGFSLEHGFYNYYYDWYVGE